MFGLRILLRDDLTPSGRMAWFTIIIVLPFFGAPVYFLFGEVDIGHHARVRTDAIFNKLHAIARRASGRGQLGYDAIHKPYQYGFRYAASIHGFHPVTGNAAELMSGAAMTRDRIIQDIDEAQDHVHVLYYIWLADNTGTDVARALIRAARRGVTCRVMADGLGSRAFIRSPYWRDMKKAGVNLAVARPLNNLIRTVLTSRIDLRNHRKITVIDGRVTYCGSQNCADPEFRVKAKYAPWVDVMMRVTGPVVAQNQLLFASDWMFETGEDIIPLDLISCVEETDGFAAQVMGDGPTIRRGATPQMFATLFSTASESLTISTPYFVPDALVLDSLTGAALRGVTVTLIVPRKNDSWIVSAVSRSYYRKLLTAGVRIFEFEGGLLHAKTLTIDGQISVIGSSNLDQRSFDLNYENNMLISDETLTDALSNRQKDFLANAVPVTMTDVESWSMHLRIWQNIMATLGPVL
ncbi:MAG TPA: cardiolipin synthase [Aliiroseovarius sp.]|nr:cardiolipin synthase [Aliiroseovarius sp.]